METEISKLSAGIKTAENDKAHALKEAQRYKDLAEHARNNEETAWLPSCSLESSSSSVVAVIGGSPGMHSSCCGDVAVDMCTANRSNNNSPASCTSAAAVENHKNLESTVALPEIVRYPNGTIQRTWPDGHISTTFINGDIKQELPSGTIEYFFKEVSVWQVSHLDSGIETFYFPNGRVESHLPFAREDGSCVEKETLLPGGAGALRTFDGSDSRQLPVKISSLRKETLLPRPVPLMSRERKE